MRNIKKKFYVGIVVFASMGLISCGSSEKVMEEDALENIAVEYMVGKENQSNTKSKLKEIEENISESKKEEFEEVQLLINNQNIKQFNSFAQSSKNNGKAILRQLVQLNIVNEVIEKLKNNEDEIKKLSGNDKELEKAMKYESILRKAEQKLYDEYRSIMFNEENYDKYLKTYIKFDENNTTNILKCTNDKSLTEAEALFKVFDKYEKGTPDYVFEKISELEKEYTDKLIAKAEKQAKRDEYMKYRIYTGMKKEDVLKGYLGKPDKTEIGYFGIHDEYLEKWTYKNGDVLYFETAGRKRLKRYRIEKVEID